MLKKPYIRIIPDFDCLFLDSEGICHEAFDDEIENNEYELGPCFRFAVPGIREWLERYTDATDFAETKTKPSFDWPAWHREGLLFAKEIRRNLPTCYTLYYDPPYEDKSKTLNLIEVDNDVNQVIESLPDTASVSFQKPSILDHLKIIVTRNQDILSITVKNQNISTLFTIYPNELNRIKHWLIQIIEDKEDAYQIHLNRTELMFFPQRIGLFPEMGRLWIQKGNSSDNIDSAYVNKREFVKSFYLSLMTELGFNIYDIKLSEDSYPEGESLIKYWIPYNKLKSRIIEWYITDEYYHNYPKPTDDSDLFVCDSYVMFPEYGGCIFWDTMGVGSGDSDTIFARNGHESGISLNVPGLHKWASYYDCHNESQSYEEYWEEGWKYALQVRKQIPKHIDLYYMCYNPERPKDRVLYNGSLPRIIVPFIDEKES
ncbi:MAG: hypothetical protein MJZ73_08715 [Bacteroidaceae bacterium]|nr:hypothetical protein [Bacteroidaceae bacterium]